MVRQNTDSCKPQKSHTTLAIVQVHSVATMVSLKWLFLSSSLLVQEEPGLLIHGMGIFCSKQQEICICIMKAEECMLIKTQRKLVTFTSLDLHSSKLKVFAEVQKTHLVQYKHLEKWNAGEEYLFKCSLKKMGQPKLLMFLDKRRIFFQVAGNISMKTLVY